MKNTIWVINQTAGTLESGWGERHLMLSKNWIKNGFKVIIISGSYNHLFINQPKIDNKTFCIDKIEEGITFCWVKTPKYYNGGYKKFWSNLIFVIRLIFLPVKKIGIPKYIIVSSMPIFPIINAYFFKKKFRVKKLIFEIRDLWPLTPIYLKRFSKFHPFIIILSLFERFAYRKSDCIVSLLPNAASYVNKISKNPKKFCCIPNGIDSDFLESKSIPKNLINKIPKNKFLIAYTGTMGMANALEYLIEASKLLSKIHPKIHFVLIGDGYLKPKLIENTKQQTNITFIPKIDKNQVQAFLKFVDLCFIGRNNTPLFNFGVSSNKYFDYMLAKKPILVSSNNIKDPVELSGCGNIVIPENARAIADGILEFYNMDDLSRENLGLKGYRYVKKYHNFTVLSNKYLKLFN